MTHDLSARLATGTRARRLVAVSGYTHKQVADGVYALMTLTDDQDFVEALLADLIRCSKQPKSV